MTVAIDPDIDFSGVAVAASRGITVSRKSFPDLIDYIKSNQPTEVLLEAGWLNKKSNFHGGKNDLIRQSIARSVGENHAVGKLIAQFCAHLGVHCTLVKPFHKIWKNGKISHEEINTQLVGKGFTPLKRKTNQDERDALLILLMWL